MFFGQYCGSVSFSFYIDETYVSTLVVKIYQILVRKKYSVAYLINF